MTRIHDPQSGPVPRDWFGLAHFRPGARFLRDGARLFLLEEAGSTNDFLRGQGPPCPGRLCVWDGWGWQAQALRELPPVADAGPGTVVAARRQTAGHGRQGRAWLDCGGLNLSVVVPPHRVSLERGFSVWLGLMTVLVLRQDLRIDARLKWPNDIVVNRRKLGGLLLQRQVIAEHSLTVAGLGLNLTARLAEFPASLQGRATSVLIETGREVRPALVAGALVNRVEDELDRFDQLGWAPYRQALDNLDCLLGKEVRAVSAGKVLAGRAAGIDDGGALLLELAGGGAASLQAGDVHLLAEGTQTGTEPWPEAGR